MTASVARVGVIGLGHWGPNLARNLAELGALAGICDADAETVARAATAAPGTPTFERFEDLLAEPGVDAVAIATPAVTHGALVRLTLEAGKHVFVEKPMCLDLEEAESLNAMARDYGLVLMVGHLMLYHPAFQALQAAVAAGRLGRLRYVYSNRLSLGKIRREENALWSFAPHDISMILALTGSMPSSVIASGGFYLRDDVADTTMSQLHFPGGVQAHIFVSWLHPYKDQRLVVIGERAMVTFNDVASGSDKLLIYDHQAHWDGAVPVVSKAEAQALPFDAAEPLRRECETFLRCIATRARPPSDAAEGIRVLTVLDACQRAIATGAEVALAAA